MSGSYWSRTLDTQISRRRALAATGAASVGAALLAACGSGGGSGSGLSGGSSLLHTPVDTTNQAKQGGIFHSTFGDPPSLDVIFAGYNPGYYWTSTYAYPRLLKWKVVKYPNTPNNEVEGDIAESYELSGDKMTLTVKLRQGLKWDLKTPRDIDSQDIVFSWKKSEAESRHTVITNNNINPDAPITGMTALDNRTVQIKLARPDPAIFPILAAYNLVINFPREAGMPAAQGGFDPKNEIRGYGPFLFVEWKTGELLKYRRNPNWYVKDRPFFDGVELHRIPEYATRLAQFRAGELYSSVDYDSVAGVGLVNATDVLPTKRDLPQLLLTQQSAYQTLPTGGISFGYTEGSPFRDKRVRQAFSFLIDRDLINEATADRDYEAAGLDVGRRTSTTMGPGWPKYWLNPDDEKAFGPNAKYFRYDPAEAKKLLTAAGFASGFETTYLTGSSSNTTEILVQMLTEGGNIRPKYELLTTSTQTNLRLTRAYSNGENNNPNLNGFFGKGGAEYPDFGIMMANLYLAGGGSFMGMTPNGLNPEKGDPAINSIVQKIRQEFDTDKVKDLAYQFQRDMAELSYMVVYGRHSLGFHLTWPALQNMHAYKTPRAGGVPQTELLPNMWLDQTKPPFVKA